ncbi:MAG: translation elongation factor 4 [Patescibacteria group bacterium]
MAPVRMIYHSDRRPAQNEPQTNADSDLLYQEDTYRIRGAIFAVRKNLGLGHKEGIYGNALEIEFEKAGISFEREKTIELTYEGKKIGVYRPDFILENKILLELKSLPFIGQIEEKQLWSYLKGSQYKLAFLVNFGGKDVQIKRIIYDTDRFLRESALSPRQSAQVEYVLNLIDTPGHSDFSYEVSRALAAVEGAVLLVDATQGVQAQTLANFENAKRAGLTVIGVVNKIDVAAPEQVESSLAEISALLGVDPGEILRVSGKTGAGVPELLERIVSEIPPPHAASGSSATARGLVFDSLYDEHKGVIAFVRVFSGRIVAHANAELLAIGVSFKMKEIGRFSPAMKPCDELNSGDIGYVATGIKDPGKIKIGDTLAVRREGEACEALAGYREPQPVVFVSFYPEDPSEYDRLRQTLGYLRLNDSALRFEPDMNEVLGRGFKGGFLGRLHFEIAADRLEREFGLKTVHSFPSVAYEVKTEKGWSTVTNPRDFPDHPLAVKEPVAKIEILSLPEYLGAILQLKDMFRFYDIEVRTMGGKSIMDAKLPLAELVSDFDDRLKSASKGFASMSYEPIGYADADVVKIDILVAESVVPGLTRVVFAADVERIARTTVERLKELLPGQQFSQSVQASVGGRIIARETIPAMKKLLGNFGKTGGDRTRKMKLWKKQKEGKKRLQERGTSEQVKIPASIFKELLKK